MDNSTITTYLYDDYGNNIKSTTKIENEDGTESIGIVEDIYDILNRLVLSKSNDKETSYVYDAAGRTLLVKADGEYSRTVYDNHGRVIQEIDNSDYNPELDNLPYAYSDSTAGHTYTYAQNGNLVSEVNKFGIETEYTYSDTGAVSKKHFDIYDYYYLPDGKCDKVEVSGKTIVDYDYDTTDESITLEKGQSLNRVTYADGNVDLQIVDENGAVVKRYNNGQSYYSTLPTASGERFRYGNSRADAITTISSKDNVNTILKSDFSLRLIQSYQVTTHDDYVAINEQHFAKSFVTGIYQDSISFSSAYGKIDVSYNKDENTEDVTQTIKNGENTLLSSSYVYNDENDRFEKSYANDVLDDVSFYVQYDNDGNIISDERNTYTYGEYGQLASVSGVNNASYSYDERGNILTKTDNGETTSFTYANSEWKDQLTKVNDTQLTYDANGNMVSYGDTQFTWSYGKSLSSIKGDEKSYYYNYDENGIRTSKTVNGKTTRFNTLGGVVLAQSDASGIMYFQYDSAGAPIGFVYNDVQYLYITNISGDVVGITDAEGNPIAAYTYDAWGKLLDITTAEENNEEQLSLANANPLRYRGYYYDNETGYYYLQSRYYNPEWGRFISADSFAYLDTQNSFSLNAYIYCWNCPTIFEDAEGTTPTISIDIEKIFSFISNTNEKISVRLQEGLQKFSEGIEKLKVKFTEFGEKIKFYFDNPDVFANDTLSKFSGKKNQY